jgi:hypothetical protein
MVDRLFMHRNLVLQWLRITAQYCSRGLSYQYAGMVLGLYNFRPRLM